MENNPLLDISRISGKRGSKKSEDRQLMEECRFHIGDVVQHFKRENVNLETAEYLYRLRHHFIWQNYLTEEIEESVGKSTANFVLILSCAHKRS